MFMENPQEPARIEIGQETLKHLNTLRKWTMFLAVSGFIFLGLIVTLGLITGTFLTAFDSDKMPGLPDVLVYAAFTTVILIIFFPILFLFRFSKHTSKAVETLDRKEMHIAIKYLKRYFIYIGVLLIVIISAYIASIVLAGTSAAFPRGF
jgi:NADH:ubiquinone oxidoreductase subunit 6 (subunit J)